MKIELTEKEYNTKALTILNNNLSPTATRPSGFYENRRYNHSKEQDR